MYKTVTPIETMKKQKTFYFTETIEPAQLCEKIRSVGSKNDLASFIYQMAEYYAQEEGNDLGKCLADDIMAMINSRIIVEMDTEDQNDAYSVADLKYPGHFID